MTDDTRILTDAETRTRRAEQASSAPNRAITLCAHDGCNRAAAYGPWCGGHRIPAEPTHLVTAYDLTETEYAAIRADVEAKAAPLFLLAMDWIVRTQLADLGVPQLAGPVTITRTGERR